MSELVQEMLDWRGISLIPTEMIDSVKELVMEKAALEAKLEATEASRVIVVRAGDALAKIVETVLREKGFSEEAMIHWPELIAWADAAAQQEEKE